MTIDRLFMDYRSVGNRLYRVSSLPLLRKILNNTKNNLRPEGTMLREAVKLGYKIKPIQDVIGVHDFFQFSRDLFRKGYTCSFKHLDHSSDLLSTWKRLSKDSVDFSILLKGFAFGLSNKKIFQQNANSEFFINGSKQLSNEFNDYDNNLLIPENIIVLFLKLN